jgi:6-phosphofructo-2-kinase
MRRQMIWDFVVKKKGYKLFFVESICDDPMIIEQNIMVSIDEVFIFLVSCGLY